MSDEKVLVVDDSLDSRELLSWLLNDNAYAVDAVESGEAALEALKREPYSIVLLDLEMPGLSGFDVLKVIRARHSAIDLPVLIVTANSSNETIIESIGLGANDFIIKPFDFSVVMARIEGQLNIKRAIDAARRELAPPPANLLDGRYELLELIGRGGYALVYKARQLTTQQIVAIKILQTHRLTSQYAEAEMARFDREIKVIGQIRHPNIVRLIDAGHAYDGLPAEFLDSAGTAHPYIVMEYLAGETLLVRLRREASFSVPDALHFLLPVMQAVDAAHAHGVLHRDLKPANIFLADFDGVIHPRVLDFGIAKLTNDAGHRLTQTASVVGTPAYMSPEQAQDKALTPACDQYSLAVLLYQCLTGRLPYRSRAVVELLEDVARARYIPLGQHNIALPFGFEAVFDRAMCRKPKHRYASVATFVAALSAFATPALA